jgi:putative heme transporter
MAVRAVRLGGRTSRRKVRDVSTSPRPGDPLSPRARTWLIRAALIVLAVVATVAAFRLIGAIDWHAVWDGLRHLDWWQVPLLVALLLLRQTVNSLPLSLYIDGVSPYRAVLNDQVAFTIGVVAPTPSDLALRTAMFSSWGVPIPAGLAGALLHKLTFWIIRFGVPAVGLVILLVRGDELGLRLIDLASIAFSVCLLVVLLRVMRSDALARSVGRRGGTLVGRFRSSVDPERWADGCARFRADVHARFRGGFPRALAAMVGLLVIDVFMLILCLRFVGVPRSDVPASIVVAAYAVAYPLTLFFFSGLGLLDAAIVGAITAYGGHGVEAPAVAAMIVWRVFTLGGPIALGAVSVVLWHRTTAPQADLWKLIRGRGDVAH